MVLVKNVEVSGYLPVTSRTDGFDQREGLTEDLNICEKHRGRVWDLFFSIYFSALTDEQILSNRLSVKHRIHAFRNQFSFFVCHDPNITSLSSLWQGRPSGGDSTRLFLVMNGHIHRCRAPAKAISARLNSLDSGNGLYYTKVTGN